MRRVRVKFNLRKNDGFSLVELAISMATLGFIAVALISYYHNYRVVKDLDTTEDNLIVISNEIGNFRAIYGRYPCPAPSTAIPGDNDYGHEAADCANNGTAGSCLGGICKYTNAAIGETIEVGTLPFKTLNLQESESYDGYLSRFSYGVSSELTSNTTFTLSGGAINIVDENLNSIISPENRGQFIVISHGQNRVGSISRGATQGAACNSGSALEEENCDGDVTFVYSHSKTDYDDRMTFFSSISPTEWQESENATFPFSIHLKNANGVAINANTASDLENTDQLTIYTVSSDPDNTGKLVSGGLARVPYLCTEDATTSSANCFQAKRIAGALSKDTGAIRFHEDDSSAQGAGMSCYDPDTGKDEFLVGIIDNEPVCAEEIFLACANGQLITSIDSQGSISCSDPAEAPCTLENTTTTCGPTETIGFDLNDIDGVIPSGSYSSMYSGECYMIEDYDSSYFATLLSGLTNAEMDAAIDGLNAAGRVYEACGDTAGHSLIRDTYQCNSGSWDLLITQEILGYSTFDSMSATSPPSYSPAETSATTDPLTGDLENDDYDHDCWCREDYRTVDVTCTSGSNTGTGLRVQKKSCPQTTSDWTTIYTTYEGCGCSDYETTENQSCNSYYDQINGTSGTSSLSGNVVFTYEYLCIAGVSTKQTTPIDINTDACTCVEEIGIDKTSCDSGLTNSWSWNGTSFGLGTRNEVSKSQVDVTYAQCPGTQTNGIEDPVTAEVVTTYTQGCTCDSTLTKTVEVACPSGQDGNQYYLVEWDCTLNSGLGDWEAEEDWEYLVDSSDCKNCAWVSSGSSVLDNVRRGEEVGDQCDCGSPTENFCHEVGSNSLHPYWKNCQCLAQEN